MDAIRVLQIDHVELYVPDRHEAAEWYRRVLGLHIVPEFEVWAADPGGPLMMATAGGDTKLALFQGEPQGSRPTAGFHRVAFRVDADAFIGFVRHLEEQGQDHRVADHRLAWSVYFSDPYGHRLEVTSYEHEAIRTSPGSTSRTAVGR